MDKKSIYLIDEHDIIKIDKKEITIDNLGGKALGLCDIPGPWALPFFVISKNLYDNYKKEKSEEVLKTYIEKVKSVVEKLAWNSIIIRSSAVNEGMEERGNYESEITTKDNIEYAIRNLLNKLITIPNKGMPLIVQKYIEPLFLGHMSNERRFSKDNRDWKIETYVDDNNFEQDTIGVRKWRTDFDIDKETPLVYKNRSISSELQKVAYYWSDLSKKYHTRYHIEFVCTDEKIYVVQADKDEKKVNAINPKDYDIKVSSKIVQWKPNILKLYDTNKCSKYSKLQNVYEYSKMGLNTVPFYCLDDRDVMNKLKKGELCKELEEDIKNLVEIHPVVIRMDILTNNKKEKQLLPRSNELRTFDEVKKWLVDKVELLLNDEGIFIFHNFVPATASAFAHASPSGRVVRIQALWGLPEGLYYNYHDTIIVDLGTKDLNKISKSDAKVVVKNRYKDQFIVPDENGEWKSKTISEPYDWKCSIETNDDILEIAVNSQIMANNLKKEISVMWFVGIDKTYYGSSNLAWYHEEVSISSYTSDYYKRKYFKEEEYVINSSEDLDKLLLPGMMTKVKCIRVKPNCDKDLRNKKFIERIGEFSKEHNVMILLDGTQLTHSYYQLKYTGAKVVCSEKEELFYEETNEFNKLVRDKIPDKIISNGEHVSCYVVSDVCFDRMLLEKLLEEAYEVKDATNMEDIISELADVLEVCESIIKRSQKNSIATVDILNNIKNPYIEINDFTSVDFSIYNKIQCKMISISNMKGVVKFERNKLGYRIEVQIPYEKNDVVDNINLDLLEIEKNNLLDYASLALIETDSNKVLFCVKMMIDVVDNICKLMNIEQNILLEKKQKKYEKNGGFEKGYILQQTLLKDNIIDEELIFVPENCKEIYEVERKENKYFEILQNASQKRMLIRFLLPLSVNRREIEFNNSRIREVISNISRIKFIICRKSTGDINFEIRAKKYTEDKQLELL